ncbi:MAG: hypothetical protein QGG80_03205, partial [Candidatus Krumholzibacteria bacterium]|nr:hypothetical protein [Candidatus Krumholzibacteria bacterium]
SVPLLMFYSAGLSGWFLDYPRQLFLGILMLMLVPLLLLILKVPSAPKWNIALLWVGAGLISLRVLYGVLLMERPLQGPEGLILAATIVIALVWAAVWTRYFLVSERVAKIFA